MPVSTLRIARLIDLNQGRRPPYDFGERGFGVAKPCGEDARPLPLGPFDVVVSAGPALLASKGAHPRFGDGDGARFGEGRKGSLPGALRAAGSGFGQPPLTADEVALLAVGARGRGRDAPGAGTATRPRGSPERRRGARSR